MPDGEDLRETEGRACWRTDQGDDGAPGFGVAFTNSQGTELLSRELEDVEY